MPDATWTSVESRRHLSAADRELVQHVADLEREAHRVRLVLPATLSSMRDGQAGQPRAATYGAPDEQEIDRDPRLRLWCSLHDQTVEICVADGNASCLDFGEVHFGPSDPTGSAVLSPDDASRDRKDLIFRLDRAFKEMQAAVAIMAAWPVQPELREEIEATPGEDWCRCCWKDDKYHEPITTRRSTGQRYYSDLCRWCGDMAKVLGYEPPTGMVARKHRGERITSAEIDKAKKAAPVKTSKAKGKKRRK